MCRAAVHSVVAWAASVRRTRAGESNVHAARGGVAGMDRWMDHQVEEGGDSDSVQDVCWQNGLSRGYVQSITLLTLY